MKRTKPTATMQLAFEVEVVTAAGKTSAIATSETYGVRIFTIKIAERRGGVVGDTCDQRWLFERVPLIQICDRRSTSWLRLQQLTDCDRPMA